MNSGLKGARRFVHEAQLEVRIGKRHMRRDIVRLELQNLLIDRCRLERDAILDEDPCYALIAFARGLSIARSEIEIAEAEPGARLPRSGLGGATIRLDRLRKSPFIHELLCGREEVLQIGGQGSLFVAESFVGRIATRHAAEIPPKRRAYG